MVLRILLFMLTLLLFPGMGYAAEELGRVVIDPGHGGYDPGAARKGVLEKHINLAISKEIKKLLREDKVDVLLTREDDYNHAVTGLHGKEAKRYDFERRIELANDFNADIMVSIHVNIGPRKCSGPETFYYKKSTQGKLLAELIQKELHAIPKTNHRSIKSGHYYLLNRTSMPCVIVETGFLNNPEERKKLADQKYQQIIAKAIAQGIVNYLKTHDNQQPPT